MSYIIYVQAYQHAVPASSLISIEFLPEERSIAMVGLDTRRGHFSGIGLELLLDRDLDLTAEFCMLHFEAT